MGASQRAAAPQNQPTEGENRMQIVTFNLRTDTPKDGVNSFSHRKGLILDAIEAERPDIIGFQECREHMQAFLQAHLRGYGLFGRQRGRERSESNPIAFREDRFELIGLETRWLSPTPFEPGSRYEIQSRCPRVFTHMQLRPLEGGSPIHVINTHLDHVSEEARVLGARQLIEYMHDALAVRPWPLLLTGDFNAFPDEACIRELLADEKLGLTDQTDGIEISYHGYGTEQKPRIDYIFSRGFDRVGPTRLWTQVSEGVYLSDHYPVEARLRPQL